MVTRCEDCDHLHSDSRKQLEKARKNDGSFDAWKALCLKHPRLPRTDFVAQQYLDGPPYLRCKDVNAGACPLFAERKEAE